jgi:S-adenosylmethionine hydrolase
VSNIPASLIAGPVRVRFGTHHLLTMSRTYSDAAVGVAVALVNSDDMVEIGVREGNAARQFRIERGARIELIPAQ